MDITFKACDEKVKGGGGKNFREFSGKTTHCKEFVFKLNSKDLGEGGSMLKMEEASVRVAHTRPPQA